jgi:hypothetical protein
LWTRRWRLDLLYNHFVCFCQERIDEIHESTFTNC